MPPPGIAWKALITRFCTTRPIWPLSASTGQRSPGRSKTLFTIEPWRAKSETSRTIAARSTAARTGSPPLAKVSSCCVRSRALSVARCASFRHFDISDSPSASSIAMERFPMMAVRMLL